MQLLTCICLPNRVQPEEPSSSHSVAEAESAGPSSAAPQVLTRCLLCACCVDSLCKPAAVDFQYHVIRGASSRSALVGQQSSVILMYLQDDTEHYKHNWQLTGSCPLVHCKVMKLVHHAHQAHLEADDWPCTHSAHLVVAKVTVFIIIVSTPLLATMQANFADEVWGAPSSGWTAPAWSSPSISSSVCPIADGEPMAHTPSGAAALPDRLSFQRFTLKAYLLLHAHSTPSMPSVPSMQCLGSSSTA